MTVLVLGGTEEARELATRLAEAGVRVISSLQGGVASPQLPAGEVRIGGFGGVDGLTRFLHERSIGNVVDATHPFAARITAHAAQACARAGVPLLRLARPDWHDRPNAGDWHWVADLADAKRTAERLGERVFLSIGRNELGRFADWTDRYVLVRVVDRAPLEIPDTWEVRYARGPFGLPAERDLLTSRRIDVLVTKNSGGTQTAAKLDAAAELGVAVVIVERPPEPAGVERTDSVAAALVWASSQ